MATRVKSITFNRELTAEDKMAPQMRGIIESAIEAHGVGVAVDTADVVTSMEGNITSRQPLERILGYYLPKLEEVDGLVTVERAEPAPAKTKSKVDASGEAVDGDMEEAEDEDEAETDDEEV